VGPPVGAVLLPRAGSGQRHNWPKARHSESGPVGGARERKMGQGCGIRPKRKKGFLCFFLFQIKHQFEFQTCTFRCTYKSANM
jgi:hypothetical protein